MEDCVDKSCCGECECEQWTIWYGVSFSRLHLRENECRIHYDYIRSRKDHLHDNVDYGGRVEDCVDKSCWGEWDSS